MVIAQIIAMFVLIILNVLNVLLAIHYKVKYAYLVPLIAKFVIMIQLYVLNVSQLSYKVLNVNQVVILDIMDLHNLMEKFV